MLHPSAYIGIGIMYLGFLSAIPVYFLARSHEKLTKWGRVLAGIAYALFVSATLFYGGVYLISVYDD